MPASIHKHKEQSRPTFCILVRRLFYRMVDPSFDSVEISDVDACEQSGRFEMYLRQSLAMSLKILRRV